MYNSTLLSVRVQKSPDQNFSEGLFQIARPPTFPDYLPGACVALRLRGVTRSYSIMTSNEISRETGVLDFFITLSLKGQFSNAIVNCRSGDEIEIVELFRMFPLLDKSNDSVYISAGSGIAPLMSISTTSLRPLKYCFHGRRYKSTLLQERMDHLISSEISCSFAISREGNGVPKHVVDLVTAADLERWARSDTTFYVCGGEAMIVSTVEHLLQGGIQSSNIYTEFFL